MIAKKYFEKNTVLKKKIIIQKIFPVMEAKLVEGVHLKNKIKFKRLSLDIIR